MTSELELNDSELEQVLGGVAAGGGGYGYSTGGAYGNASAYGYYPSSASGAYSNTYSGNASGGGLAIGVTGTNSAGFGASEALYGGASSSAGASGTSGQSYHY